MCLRLGEFVFVRACVVLHNSTKKLTSESDTKITIIYSLGSDALTFNRLVGL